MNLVALRQLGHRRLLRNASKEILIFAFSAVSIFRLVFFVIARSVYRTEQPISNLAGGPKNGVHFTLQTKCEIAEARANAAEKQAALMETASQLAADQAFQAEKLSTKLHDKVVTVFGIGSRAHAVLDAVATSRTE